MGSKLIHVIKIKVFKQYLFAPYIDLNNIILLMYIKQVNSTYCTC